MRTWALLALAAGIAGCGGVSKQELETVKAELLANDELKAAALKQELLGVKDEYVKFQTLEQRILKQLDQLAKFEKTLGDLGEDLKKQVELANSNVIKSLQFEERLLADRLAQVRLLIEELKRAGPPK